MVSFYVFVLYQYDPIRQSFVPVRISQIRLLLMSAEKAIPLMDLCSISSGETVDLPPGNTLKMLFYGSVLDNYLTASEEDKAPGICYNSYRTVVSANVL